MHDTLPLIPIGHTRTPLLLRHDVRGFVPEVFVPESMAAVYIPWQAYLPLVVRLSGR